MWQSRRLNILLVRFGRHWRSVSDIPFRLAKKVDHCLTVDERDLVVGGMGIALVVIVTLEVILLLSIRFARYMS